MKVISLCIFLAVSNLLIAQTSNTDSIDYKKIFLDVEKGNWTELKKYYENDLIDWSKRNENKYTPIQWLIKNFPSKDDGYRACLLALIDVGASVYDLSPEGWNAFQLSVANGKMAAIKILISETNPNIGMKDKDGNTLFHLCLWANVLTTDSSFWKEFLHLKQITEYYKKSSSVFKFDRYTVNRLGQPPIIYYFGKVRPQQEERVSCDQVLMLFEPLITPLLLEVVDKSKKSAMDYANLISVKDGDAVKDFYNKLIQNQKDEERKQQEKDIATIKSMFNLEKVDKNKKSTSSSSSKRCSNYCYKCNGSGIAYHNEYKNCMECSGRGTVRRSSIHETISYREFSMWYETCSYCGGSGTRSVTYESTCNKCNGTGCNN